MTDTCFSGGATGSDTVFGNWAKDYGHSVVHFGFKGMKTDWPYPQDMVWIRDDVLKTADDLLLQANVFLKRKFPTQSEYVNNLLRRNYFQVYKTKTIYAISSLELSGNVKGGTGWAVAMGMLLNVPDIYIYDQHQLSWFRYREGTMKMWTPMITLPPKPQGWYTGIGTRNITIDGVHAIQDLYEQ
jgi:hypothetical protein